MRINKETSVCISIAKRPSNFGTTIFNEAFNHQDLDYLYKAFAVEDNDTALKGVIDGIRSLGIRGCGVSMPFKEKAMVLMDDLDQSAHDVGAINTILNENGKLKGFNTDFYGAKEALSSVENLKNKSILILGSGGVAKAICAALISMEATNITISSRTQSHADDLSTRFWLPSIPWDQRNDFKADILINATSIGMSPDSDQMPIEESALNNFNTVMDVVISPAVTTLLKKARERNLDTILGTTMTLHQAAVQYKIYTGQEPPLEVMKQSMEKLLNS